MSAPNNALTEEELALVNERYENSKNKLFTNPETKAFYEKQIAIATELGLDQLFVACVPAIKRVLCDVLHDLQIQPLELLPSILSDPDVWTKNIIDEFKDSMLIYSWLNETFFEGKPILPYHMEQVKDSDSELKNVIYSFVECVAHQPGIIDELQNMTTPMIESQQTGHLVKKDEVD